jgi:TonB family protein
VAALAATAVLFTWSARPAAARQKAPDAASTPEAPTGETAGPPAALSKAPRLVHFVEAAPPPSLAALHEAAVTLTIDVDETGKVSAVEVAKSGGEEFDAAALAAARQFVFEPGEAGGQPVPVRITYLYRFVLKPPPPPPAEAAAPGAGAAASAPKGPVVPLSGRVLRKGDRVPLVGIAVIIQTADGEMRAVTDAQGAFVFVAVPVGERVVRLRGPTIAAVDQPVTLTAGKALEQTYYVDAKERYSSTVRGKRAVVETVEHRLATEEIRRIPGTQGDTLKAVQNLPGVARAPFGIGLLPVWGSAPRDTRVFIDGVAVPNLYHFGGLRSTVNGEMVDGLTFAPGGFGVEHGLGLGGVVDVETRHPRSDGFHGYAQADLVDGSLMLEGPITKTLSFAVAARRSWLDLTLPHLTSNDLQLSPVYYDYQARLSWRPTKKDDVDLFFLGSDDRLKLIAKVRDDALQAAVSSHTYYHRVIGSWLHRLDGGGTVGVTSSVGYDVPTSLGVQLGAVPTSVDIGAFEYTTRAEARLPLAAWLRLDAGLDFEGTRFGVNRAGAASPTTNGYSGTSNGGFGGDGGFGGSVAGFAVDNYTLYANNVAPFVTANLSFFNKRLTITPGFRLQAMSFVGYQGTPESFGNMFVAPEPRVAVRYQLTKRLALKGSFGLYDQAPPADAFSAKFGNPNIQPEHATHYVAGAEYEVTPTLHVEANAFYKDMTRLIVPGESASDPILTNDGVGRSYGGELLIRQELWKNFFGWASYTLSRSERKDHPDQTWHRFQFDQTHILTLMGSYVLPRGWQVGARFRYVTGNPYTPVLGAYFDSNSGRYTALQGLPFSTRLDPFMQLDLRVDKTFTFDKWRLSLYLDVQNVTRASNPEAFGYNFDFSKAHPISGLPLLPIFGIRGDF